MTPRIIWSNHRPDPVIPDVEPGHVPPDPDRSEAADDVAEPPGRRDSDPPPPRERPTRVPLALRGKGGVSGFGGRP